MYIFSRIVFAWSYLVRFVELCSSAEGYSIRGILVQEHLQCCNVAVLSRFKSSMHACQYHDYAAFIMLSRAIEEHSMCGLLVQVHPWCRVEKDIPRGWTVPHFIAAGAPMRCSNVWFCFPRAVRDDAGMPLQQGGSGALPYSETRRGRKHRPHQPNATALCLSQVPHQLGKDASTVSSMKAPVVFD